MSMLNGLLVVIGKAHISQYFVIMTDIGAAKQAHAKEVKAWMDTLDGTIHTALDTSNPNISFREEQGGYVVIAEQRIQELQVKPDILDL